MIQGFKTPMLPSLIDISLFRDAIEKNQLILTANQRLAAQIQQAWGQSINTTTQVWKAPRVMSLEHWLSFCWNELQDQNHPLTEGRAHIGRLQNLYYWEQSINNHDSTLDQSFASMANDCFELLERWNIESDSLEESSTAIYKFKRWVASYQNLLTANKLATSAFTWQAVGEGFSQQAFATEKCIYLYGFQSISPLQQNVLNSASHNLIPIVSEDSLASIQKVQCSDPNKEIEAAATWAAQELLQNSAQRIGIVLPDLNNRMQQTARVINEALAANNCSTAVNITAGTKLSETPINQSALNLLGLLTYQLPMEHWLSILYSPYGIFEQLPIQFRVNCELDIRKLKAHELGLEKFIQIIRGQQAKLSDPDSIQPQIQPLYDIQQNIRQTSGHKNSFTKWAEYFNDFVKQLGWPGTGQPSSIQYQQIQCWDKLLIQLSELDNLEIKVGRAKALSYLQKLANEHLFHPQTGDAPLQVLGLLEAVGLQFDQLWIAGMHSGNFPASGSMDIVLPANFQRMHKMPFSVPEKELQIAKDLLSGFAANTKQIIISSPISDGKTPLEESPLIKHIKDCDLQSILGELTLPDWLMQPNQAELVSDPGYAFNFSKEPIGGGSSILKNQSTCPFNAFAVHRLWAKAFEEPALGLEPMDRGSIIHEILYRLWGQWKTSDILCALPDDELSHQVSQTIENVLSEQATKSPILLGDNFKYLEQQRLSKTIYQWLNIEKQRQPFEVIAKEQKKQITLGDLKISLIMDRLDTVNNNSVVIDYKTGNVKPNAWLGDRPKDPQLPLYTLATDPSPQGCAFASLKGNDPKFIGLSKDPIIDGIKPCEDWPLQLKLWQQAIQNLADEFVDGQALLHNFNDAEFNYQADLLPFNRWNEQQEIQRLVDADKSK